MEKTINYAMQFSKEDTGKDLTESELVLFKEFVSFCQPIKKKYLEYDNGKLDLGSGGYNIQIFSSCFFNDGKPLDIAVCFIISYQKQLDTSTSTTITEFMKQIPVGIIKLINTNPFCKNKHPVWADTEKDIEYQKSKILAREAFIKKCAKK